LRVQPEHAHESPNRRQRRANWIFGFSRTHVVRESERTADSGRTSLVRGGRHPPGRRGPLQPAGPASRIDLDKSGGGPIMARRMHGGRAVVRGQDAIFLKREA
jgi:hypothetical protein